MTHDDILDRLQAEIDAEAANPSPVRRRTVTEIVPGVYGRIRVYHEHYEKQYAENGVGVGFTMRDDSTVTMLGALNAAELRAAAATLVALADALDEMGGAS